jgi:lysophospholipase L1-like esterase
MRKLIIILFLVLFSACEKYEAVTEVSAKPPDAVKAEENKKKATKKDVAKEEKNMPVSYFATDAYIKPLGRTYFNEDNILWCNHSGTGAEFLFNGTFAEIVFAGDNAATGGNRPRLAIYLNGERVVDELIDAREKTFTVFKSDEPIEAVITVIKLSEAAMSSFGIKEINVIGTPIEPTLEKDMLIEFIGDSITVGYGVDNPKRNGDFSPATEDFTKTYAYKTAVELDADYSVVAFSGYGLVGHYTKVSTGVASVPRYYDKIGYTWAQASNFKPSEIEWDFNKNRQPNIIVINLGTNDEGYTKKDTENVAVFVEDYAEFLKELRLYNPDAAIICTLGAMGAGLFPAIEQAVANVKAETGDDNIYSLRFDQQTEADGINLHWHPSENTHIKMARKLVDFIVNREMLS